MVNDNTANDTRRVWELMKKIGFAMPVTRDGDKLRARPMSACLDRDAHAILLLTDARRHKDDEIAVIPVSTSRSPMPAARNTSPSPAPPRSPTIAKKSVSCSRRRQRHGGIRPRIPTFAC